MTVPLRRAEFMLNVVFAWMIDVPLRVTAVLVVPSPRMTVPVPSALRMPPF